MLVDASQGIQVWAYTTVPTPAYHPLTSKDPIPVPLPAPMILLRLHKCLKHHCHKCC